MNFSFSWHIFFLISFFFLPKNRRKIPEVLRSFVRRLLLALGNAVWPCCGVIKQSFRSDLTTEMPRRSRDIGGWDSRGFCFFFSDFCWWVVGKLGNLWMPLMYFNLYVYLYKLHTYLVYMHTYKIVKSHDWGDDHPLFEWRKWSSNPCSHEEQWWFPKGTWLKTRVHFQIPCLGVYVIS